MIKLVMLLVSSSICYSQHYYDYGRPLTDDSDVYKESIIYENKPSGRMDVLYAFSQVDFTFSSENVRDSMIRNLQYIPKNNMILDVDFHGGKVFLTVPRVRPGVPATLTTVSSLQRHGEYLLAPFPDWRSNTNGDCVNSITSVFRVQVDSCGKLWVLDSGNNNAFNGNGSNICPPQILLFDLNNNNCLVGKYRIPSDMVETNSLFVTIAVDTRQPDCSDAYAYIADSIAYKMIVFDIRSKNFRRFNSILFNPYPDHSIYAINGISFDLSGGIFGLALGPVFRGHRLLYFHSIDSIKQSWVDTAILRNETSGNSHDMHLFFGTRSSQSAAATMTRGGIMFFGLVATNEITCYNTQTPFARRYLQTVAQDDVTLQFNSGIKTYDNSLYAVTCRLQNYLNNMVDENEVNYRVLVGNVEDLTRDTICEADDLGIDSDYEPFTDSENYLYTVTKPKK